MRQSTGLEPVRGANYAFYVSWDHRISLGLVYGSYCCVFVPIYHEFVWNIELDIQQISRRRGREGSGERGLLREENEGKCCVFPANQCVLIHRQTIYIRSIYIGCIVVLVWKSLCDKKIGGSLLPVLV